MRRENWFRAATLIVPAILTGSFANAQNTDIGADETVIEEIIVTASRREESLQEVSASVSALTTDDILRQGLDNFGDFARVMPGVTLNQSIRNRGVFNIRGIATNVTGGNTQDPVAVYINDTPITDTFGAIVQPDLRLFDVARIEVLRGPQGTLFGSGSLGGTVRIITNQPDPTDFDFAARIDIGVTDGGSLQQRYDAMLNAPLVEDELALRVVAYARDEEGWVDNVTLGTSNSTSDWGGRLALQWQPSDRFTVNLNVTHQDSDPEDGDAWNPANGKFKKTSSIPEGRPSKLTNYGLSAEYEWEGFATLITSTTFQDSDSAFFGDAGDVFGMGLPVLQISDPWDSEFFTQELRLVSNTDSNFEWVVGAFYIDRDTDVDYLIELPGLDDLFGGLIGSDAFFESPIATASRETAGFADISYRFAERWKAGVGIRIFDTKVSYSEPNRQTLNFQTLTYDVDSLSSSDTDSDSTWRAVLSYEPSDDALVYASAATGYRIGQVNPNNGPSPVDPNDIVIPVAYGPDQTLNYELGARTTWLDGRLILNAAAYFIEWEDMQIDGLRVSDFGNFIANAGEAESKGFELELNARPTDGLEFALAVTTSDTEITSLPDNFIVPAAVGDTLPGTVELKVSGSAQYSWDAFADKQMYIRLDGQSVDSSPNGFEAGGTNPFYAINDSYENVNLAVGLVSDKWDAAIYGTNITDDDSYILNTGSLNLNYINTLRPMTIGVRFNYRY